MKRVLVIFYLISGISAFGQIGINSLLIKSEWNDYWGYYTFNFNVNDSLTMRFGDKNVMCFKYELTSDTLILFDKSNDIDTLIIKKSTKDSLVLKHRDKEYLRLSSSYSSNLSIDTALYVNFFKNKTYIIFPFDDNEPDFLIFNDSGKVICGDTLLNVKTNWRIVRFNNNYFFETDLFILKVIGVGENSINVLFGYSLGHVKNEEFIMEPYIGDEYNNKINQLLDKYR